MSRNLLLAAAAALCALAVLAAPTLAAPVTPVLSGGKLTYSGSATANEKTDDDDYKNNETATLSWSTEHVLANVYENGVPLLWADSSPDPLSWTKNGNGTWNEYINVRYWNEDRGYYWEDNTCDATASDPEGPGALPPAQKSSGGYKVTVDAHASLDWKGKCADPDGPGSPFGSDLGIVYAAMQDYNAGLAPRTGASHTQNVSINTSRDCGGACTSTITGGGTMKLEPILKVEEITFLHPDLPSNQMTEVPAGGTTDGNPVRVVVRIRNTSNRAFTSQLAFRERKSKRVLYSMDFTSPVYMPVDFPAGATKTVEFMWNTDGFAFEKGKPQADRELEVVTALGGGYAPIKVQPKPVVLVHGWNSDASTWDAIKPHFKTIHPGYADRTFAVGDGQQIGTMNTDPGNGWAIERNARALDTYVQDVRQDLDARHVDVVAHSMGGLISRIWIQERMPVPPPVEGVQYLVGPVARHLVMLGTPNEGSPCAILMSAIYDGIPTWQLRPDYAEMFNKNITQRKNVLMSVLAGDWEERTCQSPKHGDLVVEVESAWSTFTDVGKTYINHLDMTSRAALFDTFVKDRIAADPDGVHNPTQGPGRRSARAAGDRVEQQITARRSATVPGGGTTDVALPVGKASALTVGLVAPATLTAELRDPSGSVVDRVEAGSDAARQPMRFHRAENPAPGTFTVRLVNTAGAPAGVEIVAAEEGSALRLTASATQPAGGGPVTVEARFPAGASVEAVVRGDGEPDRKIVLEPAGSDLYRGQTESLPAAEWFASVAAESGAGKRYAGAVANAAVDGITDPGGNGDDGDGGGGAAGPVGGSGVGAAPAVAGGPGRGAGSAGGAIGRGSATEGGSAARRSGAKLTAKASTARPRRGRRRITVTGRVSVPRGASCRGGVVSVSARSGGRSVAQGRATLDRTCRFRLSLSVSARARGVRLVAVFGGSPTLAPSKPVTVKP